MTIGLFYSTETGSTERVANAIRNQLGADQVELYNIASTLAAKMEEHPVLIFGAPTMGYGELADDWQSWIDDITSEVVNGKTVALFGLGDQEGYPDTFLDAMGIIYDHLQGLGANVVGAWPADGYEFSESRAVKEGQFVGLALDEDNQPKDTATRVRQWVERIRPHLG